MLAINVSIRNLTKSKGRNFVRHGCRNRQHCCQKRQQCWSNVKDRRSIPLCNVAKQCCFDIVAGVDRALRRHLVQTLNTVRCEHQILTTVKVSIRDGIKGRKRRERATERNGGGSRDKQESGGKWKRWKWYSRE